MLQRMEQNFVPPIFCSTIALLSLANLHHLTYDTFKCSVFCGHGFKNRNFLPNLGIMTAHHFDVNLASEATNFSYTELPLHEHSPTVRIMGHF